MIPTKKSLPRRAAGLAIVPFLMLASCEDKENSSPVADAKPVAASGSNAVPENQQSAHFAAVNGHLDLGGTLYGYMDIDGDVEKIAGLIQGFLDTAKAQAGDEMPPHLKNLNVAQVLDELGLAGVEAMGASSYKDGAIYHNKAYVHIPGGRKGLLKILGGEAAPFASKALAPADTDLAWEMTLDVQAGYEVVSTMVRRIGGPEADQEFQRAVGEMIPQLGLSMNDILTKLNTRITVIGRLHPDKPLAIPDSPVAIPSFDLLVALDDTGWLFDKIVASIRNEIPEDQQAEMFASGDGFEKLMAPPIPSPDMVIAQPVFYHDKASERVLIGSSQAFIDECLSVQSGLLDSDAYKKAADGLPTEGNALSYISPRFMKEYRRLISELVNSAPMGAGEMALMMGPMTALLDTFMPDIEQGQAGVTVNLPDGILSMSNASTSFKEAVAASGASFIAAGTLGFARTSSQSFDTPPSFLEIDEVQEIEEAPGIIGIPTEEGTEEEEMEEDGPSAALEGLQGAAAGAIIGIQEGDDEAEISEEP